MYIGKLPDNAGWENVSFQVKLEYALQYHSGPISNSGGLLLLYDGLGLKRDPYFRYMKFIYRKASDLIHYNKSANFCVAYLNTNFIYSRTPPRGSPQQAYNQVSRISKGSPFFFIRGLAIWKKALPEDPTRHRLLQSCKAVQEHVRNKYIRS